MIESIRRNQKLRKRAMEAIADLNLITGPFDKVSHPIANVARLAQIPLGFALDKFFIEPVNKPNPFRSYLDENDFRTAYHEINQVFFDLKNEMIVNEDVVWSDPNSKYRMMELVTENGARFLASQEKTMFGGYEYDRDLYAAPGTEDDVALLWGDAFWEKYGNFVTFSYDPQKKEVRPVELTLSDDRKYIGPHSVDKMDNYIRAYEAKGFSRSFLFQGPPGTGKTTIAYKLAERREGRALHLTANVIRHYFGIESMNKIISILRPSVILIDDIHLMNISGSSDMLHFLEWVNEHPTLGTLLIATSNEMSAINKAMRRPGRFDEVLIFDCPEEDDRREVIRIYAELYNCTDVLTKFGEDLFEKLVYFTKDLTHAFIKDLVKFLSAMQDLEEEPFIHALNQRLISMRIATGYYTWAISREAIDINQPLPSEEILRDKIKMAKANLAVLKNDLEKITGRSEDEEKDKSEDQESESKEEAEQTKSKDKKRPPSKKAA